MPGAGCQVWALLSDTGNYRSTVTYCILPHFCTVVIRLQRARGVRVAWLRGCSGRHCVRIIIASFQEHVVWERGNQDLHGVKEDEQNREVKLVKLPLVLFQDLDPF